MFMIKFFCKTRSFEAPSQKVSTNVRHLSTSFLLVVEMEVLVDMFFFTVTFASIFAD